MSTMSDTPNTTDTMPAIPSNWTLARVEQHPFKAIEVVMKTSTPGVSYVARIMAHQPNPTNLFYLLCDELLCAQEKKDLDATNELVKMAQGLPEDPAKVTEDDGCPTELAVLQRFWRGEGVSEELLPLWFKNLRDPTAHPPYEGPPCPMCRGDIRNLSACAHNVVTRWEMYLANGTTLSKVASKIADLKMAVHAIQPLVDYHFKDSMHSHGTK